MRLEAGSPGEGYAYGRLEVFLRGFWSNVCSAGRFTPDSAQVACRQLGFDGGSSLTFRRPPRFAASPVQDQVSPTAPPPVLKPWPAAGSPGVFYVLQAPSERGW